MGQIRYSRIRIGQDDRRRFRDLLTPFGFIVRRGSNWRRRSFTVGIFIPRHVALLETEIRSKSPFFGGGSTLSGTDHKVAG